MDANTDVTLLTENLPESAPHQAQDNPSTKPAVTSSPQPSPNMDKNNRSTLSEQSQPPTPPATSSSTTVPAQPPASATASSEPTAVPGSETQASTNPPTTLQTNNQNVPEDEEVDESDSEDSFVGECLTEEREFVAVEGYRSEANKEFNGTAATWGQIQERDESRFHPRQPLKRWDSVSLKVAVAGGRVAPHLALRAIVEDENEKGTVHVGQLDFYSGAVQGVGAQIIGLTLSREATEGRQTDGDFDGSYLCKFYTHGGIPSFLWLPRRKGITYDQDTCATFRVLQGLTHQDVTSSGAGTVQVVLKIRAKVGAHDDNEALWKALQDLAGKPVQPWHQYLRPSGLPECQFGSMVKRSIIAQEIPLIQYPAENFFVDVVEAEVKLAYCASMEYEWKQAMLDALELESHKVSFVHVGRRMILALVRVNGQYTPNGDRIAIDPGTTFQLKWKATGHGKRQSAVGVTIENWLGLPDIDMMLMVSKEAASFLDVDPPMAGAWDAVTLPGPFSLNVKTIPNKADVKRQISAIHTLCNSTVPTHRQWWPLLLNQNVLNLPAQTVAGMAGVDADRLREACEVASHLLPWNPEQKKVLRDGGKFHGGACLFEGPPGTGKTQVLAALALIYLLCDFHVLLVAPTGSAADNEATDLIKFLHSTGLTKRFEPVRIYRPLAEKRGLHRRPEENVEGMPTDDPDAQLLELLVELKKELGRRSFNLRDISLQARTTDRAREKRRGDILLASYPPDPDAPPIVLPTELPTVDMWEEFRQHIKRVEQTPLHEWSPEERRRFRHSWKCCRDVVVAEARCIITTDSNAACEFVRSKFGGEEPKGIFILQDEAANESEARTWIPVVKLSNYAHVKGLVMVGDVKQLPPCFLTANEKCNEFVEQGLNPLYTRLLAQGFPSVKLKVQYRMHPAISYFPNRRTYLGRLVDAESTHTRARDADFDKFIGNFLGTLQKTEASTNPVVACLNVDDGVCVIDNSSPSKLNVNNVNVVMSLLLSRWKESEGKAKRNVTIIVPYRAQKALYVQRILLASKDLKIQPGSLAKVVTVDGFQGKEDDIVILDTVVTEKLGFLEAEERMNVAFTRAKDNLIIVAKMSVTAESRFANWKEDKGTDTGIRVLNPKPFLIAYLEHLQSNNRVFMCTGAKLGQSTYQPETVSLGMDEDVKGENEEVGGNDAPEQSDGTVDVPENGGWDLPAEGSEEKAPANADWGLPAWESEEKAPKTEPHGAA